MEDAKYTAIPLSCKLTWKLGLSTCQLAHPDIAARCDWSRWHVFWVDERAVPLTHPDSNYLLAHTHWLSKVPIPSAHIHTLDDSLPVEAAAEAYEREMARCVEAGVLPMHPVEAAAAEAYDLELRQCVEAGVLLTHPVLLSAAVVAVVAMGEGKRELLGRLFEAGGTGFAVGTGLPASMVLPRDGELIWMVDREAAAGFLQDS
ncbi:unnamed protein product [Closterium sp. NIES-65]|nr:unnamed protein product [Closterium sp. NIES-65]